MTEKLESYHRDHCNVRFAAINGDSQRCSCGLDAILEKMIATLLEKLSVSVNEIRSGEENDGPLQSTDLFVTGRGVSVLCNVGVGESFTYAVSEDGKPTKSGTVGQSVASGRTTVLRCLSCGRHCSLLEAWQRKLHAGRCVCGVGGFEVVHVAEAGR